MSTIAGVMLPGTNLPPAPLPPGTATPAPGVTTSTPSMTGMMGLPGTAGTSGAMGLPAISGTTGLPGLHTAASTASLPGVTTPAASGGSTQANGTGSTGRTGGTNAQDLSGTDTFLKLLVAQLQNQDPTSPMDDQSFITELAQFNTVEQMINLKQSVDAEVTSQQAGEGVAMLGKTITFTIPGIGGNNSTTGQGAVTGVMMQGGQVQLQVGTQNVPLSQVTAVTSS